MMEDSIHQQNIQKAVFEELLNELNHLQTIHDRASDGEPVPEVFASIRKTIINKMKTLGHKRRSDGYWLHPKFTDKQKEEICSRIGTWYLKWKPILIDWNNRTHRLGQAREDLKTMLCDKDDLEEGKDKVMKGL